MMLYAGGLFVFKTKVLDRYVPSLEIPLYHSVVALFLVNYSEKILPFSSHSGLN